MLTALALLASSPVHAFCGTFVGAAGAELTNHTSQVVLVREGRSTTLTVGVDYEGELQDFAIVLPVPTLLGPDDVNVVDGQLLATVDAYSAPRRVHYTCEDFRPWEPEFEADERGGFGCAQSLPLAGAEFDLLAAESTGVTVEATFTEGAYDIVVLSAEQSAGLQTWLSDNGYALPPGGDDVLDAYIEAGAYFLAAKVHLDEGSTTAALQPLQFHYESDVFSLPIRIGTMSAKEEQDVVIYAVTRIDELGQVGIANYEQVTVEDECMADFDEEELSALYDRQLREAIGEREAAWTLEYSFAPTHCDPCTTEPLGTETLAPLGFTADPYSAWFTRLRARYTPAGATQDVVLYGAGYGSNEQVRYIDHVPELEDRFPVCDVGMVEDPASTCADLWAAEDAAAEEGNGGCGVRPGARPDGARTAMGVLAMATALAITRRRR